MKILHLTTFLQGGAGRIITELALAQQRARHDVSVLTSATGVPGYGNYQDYIDQLERAGITVQLVDSTFTRDPAANLNVVAALQDWYPKGAEPDIVHTHAGVPSYVALQFAASRRRRMAVVQTMHGWGDRKTPEQAAADRDAMNLVEFVVVPSQHAARQMLSLGVVKSRLTVVPYGVGERSADFDRRDQRLRAAMDQARRDGAMVVACVGTIGPRKNQELLVQAVARLRGALRIFGFFVGDGDADGLRDLIDRAGVSSCLHVHGYSAAARRLAASADVLVLPSRSEGQPIAILEAFADGVLVVASDIPELAELVDDHINGLRFSEESADDLARVLADATMLAEVDRQRMRDSARTRWAADHMQSAMTRRYFDVYRTALRSARPGTERRLAAPVS